MLLSLHWLKEFIPNLKINEEIAESLTSLGLEVSSVIKKQKDLIIDIDLINTLLLPHLPDFQGK